MAFRSIVVISRDANSERSSLATTCHRTLVLTGNRHAAAAARVGGLDIGFVPGQGGLDVEGILDGAGNGNLDMVYLLGADEIDMTRLGDACVVYQGHHGDNGAGHGIEEQVLSEHF